MPQMLAK